MIQRQSVRSGERNEMKKLLKLKFSYCASVWIAKVKQSRDKTAPKATMMGWNPTYSVAPPVSPTEWWFALWWSNQGSVGLPGLGLAEADVSGFWVWVNSCLPSLVLNLAHKHAYQCARLCNAPYCWLSLLFKLSVCVCGEGGLLIEGQAKLLKLVVVGRRVNWLVIVGQSLFYCGWINYIIISVEIPSYRSALPTLEKPREAT